ncbi:MAG: excinuclease ABC subunit A, partial [Bacteroidales bacterium]|nr:excinuclease ABC subunit A [Bacteroidales bacterium]
MIVAKGIKVNNLKNIDVNIPTNKLVVITGVSGSGKTSLAFDTLFAEGQRRYVESLSSYARGFLGRMNKPEVEKISGLSPAIAVEQRVMNRNPRSTVGTTTEIYEYIKLLFARIGKTYSPISNKEVKRHSVQNVVDEVLETFENQTKILVVSPLKLKAEENLREKLELLIQLGYVRIIIEGKIHRIEDVLEEKKLKLKEIDLLIDRLTIEKNNDEIYMRLSDSVHTAFNESDGFCNIINAEGEVFYYSNRFEADGITFVKPSANFFSFNNP